MPRLASPFTILRQLLSIRILIFISSISFTFSVLWIESINRKQSPAVNDNIVQEAIANVARDIRYFDVYRKVPKYPKHLKYILLWTSKDYSPFYFFGTGQNGFLNNNCSVINCYVTDDRNLFGGDITKFDAIAFNGRNMKPINLPNQRSPHQKYIYINMESGDNYPVCSEKFDNFFNLTATYRLDSDIPYPYILIRNTNGDIVGPKLDMRWNELIDVDEELPYKLQNKSKAVAWFVSHCYSRSGRKEFVRRLQRALDPYGLEVDIYGSCGSLKCPIELKSKCDIILERDYYFYLSLENSFGKDYVTEKLLTALQHDVVPIVYGGANYSRFLPPGSYLDARQYTVERLAETMVQLMNSPKLYQNYFKWKYHYRYYDPSGVENVCAVCAALNNNTLVQMPKVYKEFRSWWNPNYKDRCYFWNIINPFDETELENVILQEELRELSTNEELKAKFNRGYQTFWLQAEIPENYLGLLDSDIPYPYILIKDKKGDVVGPRINMEWEDTDSDITETLDKILTNKNKAAVWFVSSCDGKNEREIFAEMLKVELKVYNLSIDVYGNCGTLSCPRENQSECNRLIEKDYYFYLSFENSCAEHYVTEKLLVPLQNNAVPIVFGGANYSNYLPPGSYLNAKHHSPKDLAAIMASLIDSPKLYRQYFRWKNHYTYHNPFTVENVCALCAALNNETKLKPSSYKDFRKWWNNDDSFEGKLHNGSTTTIGK
ncbi:uncharacterized protein ACR2FA_012796 [Aphomia sociella]